MNKPEEGTETAGVPAINFPGAEVARKLNECVGSVLGASAVEGFEKAFLMADAIRQLKEMLTPQYMAPIMALQGSKLGFLTDRDKNKDGSKGPGYPEEVVKNCLIEAVLNGLQPTGNQFNIISGNTYNTKEGFGHLLSKIPGLSYSIVFDLPRIKEPSAAVVALIEWSLNGEKFSKRLDLPVKINQYMGADGVLGKGERKARAWLYKRITGSEMGDGDAEDTQLTLAAPEPVSDTTAKAADDLARILANKPIREQIAKLEQQQAGLDSQSAEYMTLAEEIETLSKTLK